MKMVLAILNWILMAFMIIFQAAWIHGILNHDGRCPYTNCEQCYFDGCCPMQEDKEKRARVTGHEDHQTKRV